MDEEFWISQLGEYKTFDTAMDHVKSLFARVHNCDSNECLCSKRFAPFDYEYYFLNETNFIDFKRLQTPMREKCRRRTVEEVNNDPEAIHFNLTTPTLNEFCLNYDWAGFPSYHYYEEVSKCTAQMTDFEVAMALISCGGSLTFVNEDILNCFFAKYDCDRDIKNYMSLGELMYFSKYVEGNLYDFVWATTETRTTTTTTDITTTITTTATTPQNSANRLSLGYLLLLLLSLTVFIFF